MGDGKPKYLNSPETEIFDKSRNLYGLNYARTSREKYMLACEGYMDVIAMHQAGFTQAVASLGTAFTSGQASLLRRYANEILLSYDSDGAGVNAALRAIGILKEAGMTGRVINLEPYKDPDEFIKNLGKEAFQERIDQAENSFYFEIRILSEQYDQSDPEQRTKFHREIAQKLCEFSEDLERENYLQAIAEKKNLCTQLQLGFKSGFHESGDPGNVHKTGGSIYEAGSRVRSNGTDSSSGTYDTSGTKRREHETSSGLVRTDRKAF